jgi:predicted PurR-regulated permease PerM
MGHQQQQQLSTRTIARVFFTLVGLAVLLYTLYLVRSVLGLIFIAVFLAIALGPAVDFFATRGVPRGASILFVFLCLFLAILFIGALFVPPVVDQVEAIAEDAPGYVEDLRGNETIRKYDDEYELSTRLTEQAERLPSRLGDAVSALQSVTIGVFSTLVQLLTVLTITFFLLLDGRRIVDFALAQLLPERRARFAAVADDVYRSVGGYVAGALTIALFCGLVTYVTLTILGVPFAIPLSVLMGFLALIPLVGATIGGVIVGLVTVLDDFPGDTIAWVVIIVVYQQIENNVLQPQVYKRTVDLHPLVIISGILIGSSLLGVLGALVAIPISAAVQIVLLDYWKHRRVRSAVVIGREGEPLEAIPGQPPTPPAPPPPSPIEISRG